MNFKQNFVNLKADLFDKVLAKGHLNFDLNFKCESKT